MDWDDILLISLVLICIVILFPASYGYVESMDTSAWSFTGKEGVIAALKISPILFLIVGIVALVMVVERRVSAEHD